LEPCVIGLEDSLALSDFRCVRQENFFPLLPLVKVMGKNDDAIFNRMLAILNENSYGLRVSAWAKSDSIIRKFIRQVDKCGLLRINIRHVEFSEYLATHGGPGKTGGPFGELNYFWHKTTHLQGISLKT
jgi:acyl-CoA reductase-like NAD-dependent aldehyde dehydrogenase